MPLNGIDVSSWQSSLVPSRLKTTAFVVVKATGGTGYSNPCFRAHADAVLASGKLLGVYHYARERGCAGSAVAEADWFVAAFAPYVGKAIPYLDWEADALSLPVSWALAWLDRVREKTGVVPGIYMSKSTCRAVDWSPVAATYPLWVAQYPNYSETGYLKKPWTDDFGYGAWDAPEMFQYTSSGRIEGYSERLDLDLFFGTKTAWKKRCKKGGAAKAGPGAGPGAGSGSGSGLGVKAESGAGASVPSTSAAVENMDINRANVAAQIMEHLATCELHGYSQPGRYGTSGYCDVQTDAGVIRVKKGDRDCSSAVCEAWELALVGTPYEGMISRYHTTYDMKEMFLATGIFTWHGMDFNASRGDIYLDIDAHTAMCVQNDASADLLAEFSISETGGIDGAPGDQTGRESSVHGYYEAWDGILHYEGGADGGEVAASGGAAAGGGAGELPIPRYRAAIMRDGKKVWLDWMEGLRDTGGSGDTFAGVPGCPIVDFEIDESTLGPGGWYRKNMSGGKLIGLTVYYSTPNPASSGYYAARYRTHWLGESPSWGKWELDDNDDGAGNDRDPVDMVEIMIYKL